jgi:hypothetical protein
VGQALTSKFFQRRLEQAGSDAPAWQKRTELIDLPPTLLLPYPQPLGAIVQRLNQLFIGAGSRRINPPD